MKWFFFILVIVNILFLSLGVLLYIYANKTGIALPINAVNQTIITDKVFPVIALNYMPAYIGIIFLIGLLAAAYSSADSALTSLTTSFCVDLLEKVNTAKTIRILIHVGFTFILFLTIVAFRYLMDSSAVQGLFKLAGYTYGPLLGMFTFAIFTKKKIIDKAVPFIAILSPILTFFIDRHSEQLLSGYKFGFELLLINGLIMFIGLMIFEHRDKRQAR